MTSKILLLLFTVTIGSCVYGQQLDYTAWKEEAKTNIRLLPEYGNVEKTKEQKAADEQLIKTMLKQEGTLEKASEQMVKLGFDYLYRNDIKTAMYRFNQAWLLDPKNEDAYWGFGAVYFMFSDFEKAMVQYEKGLTVNPKSSNILTDKATVMMIQFQATGAKEKLNSALATFKQSYDIDSKNQNTLFKLSVCYFTLDQCKEALRYYKECMALGGKPVTADYTTALNQKCGK